MQYRHTLSVKMTNMKITKQNEEITYRRTETTVTFLINDKKVRVYFHEDYDDMQGCDYDIDEDDRKTLTEEEDEELSDLDMFDLSRQEVGELSEW